MAPVCVPFCTVEAKKKALALVERARCGVRLWGSSPSPTPRGKAWREGWRPHGSGSPALTEGEPGWEGVKGTNGH